MATAAKETRDPNPLRRKSSLTWLPPDMSELRLVLLGNSWSERSSVGNQILGKTVFNPEGTPDFLAVRGCVKEKYMVLVNTPDLLHPDVSADKLTEHVKTINHLSAPGPDVFLLVLQPEDFTEVHKEKLCRILQTFSDQSFSRSLVLVSTPRQESSGSQDEGLLSQPLKDVIKKCEYRKLKLKNLELQELLTRLGQIVKENQEHVRSQDSDEDPGIIMKSKSKHRKPALNLVLCGRRGSGKTSAAEAILDDPDLHSVSDSSHSVKHQGEVRGRWVSLVELPALYGKPQQEVMEEALRCVSLCEPEGVHAFIMVLPVGPLTDEDKGELETIQETLSSRVNDFMMILFTVESDPTAPAVDKFLKENNQIQDLCQSCGGRYVVLNIKDKQQIPELLNKVEEMGEDGSRCFTKEMFTKAQMEKVSLLKAELQDVKQSSGGGSESLRMVLIGKTGSGKGTTANIILGRKHFTPRVAPKPANTSCEKTAGEVDGRTVEVLKTPDLFDTTLSDEDIQQELHKCFSMLSPGPHVFLLVLQIGTLIEDERHSVELVRRVFGQKAADFIIVVFTRGYALEDMSIESYIQSAKVKQLISDCGGRYQVFNNTDYTNRTPVRELLKKVDAMVKKNGGSCYSTETLQMTKKLEHVMKRENMQLETTSKKHSEEIKQMKSQLEALAEKEERARQQHLEEKTCCIA